MQRERLFREIKRFLLSYHFSNGLRMTIGVVLPSVIFYMMGRVDIGIGISTGALATGISDAPGTSIHKRNGLLISTALNVVVALITGLTIPFAFLAVPWIMIICFFCGMLLVYGNRGGNIGIGGLLVMVLVLGEPHESVGEAFFFTGLVLVGCLWYDLLALIFWQIRPYLSVQQALGGALIETAKYLELRGKFYEKGIDIQENYSTVLAQQIVMNEQTESVREQLLKRREDQQGTTSINKSLVMIFVETVDLQEQVMTAHIDYESLHNILPDDQILEPFRHLILLFADELKNIGVAVSGGLRSRPHHNLRFEIEKLRQRIADYRKNVTSFQQRTELVSLNNILQTLQEMDGRYHYLHRLSRLDSSSDISIDPNLELSRFITRQQYDVEVFVNNLSLRSNNFRHALRLSLATTSGYLLGEIFHLHRVYWILLTIVVILKPGFSVTKSRSTQRLVGTVIGALFAAGLLYLTHTSAIIFVTMLVCILGAYSFTTYNYTVSVFFTTPFVIFLLHFLRPADIQNVTQRVIDTFAGGAIAFLASHLLWPSWEYKFLPDYMCNMLRSNRAYFEQTMKLYTKDGFNITDFKLARKSTHVSTANLMAAFQRMLSEPKSRQHNGSQVYHFVVLNHTLSSHIATLANMGLQREMEFPSPEYKVLTDYLIAFMRHIEGRMERTPVNAFVEPKGEKKVVTAGGGASAGQATTATAQSASAQSGAVQQASTMQSTAQALSATVQPATQTSSPAAQVASTITQPIDVPASLSTPTTPPGLPLAPAPVATSSPTATASTSVGTGNLPINSTSATTTNKEDFPLNNAAFATLDEHLQNLLHLRELEVANGQGVHGPVHYELMETKRILDQLHIIHSLLKDLLKTFNEK